MSILYIITNTFGDNLFTIKPGALNGPGGIDTDSDLRLYGQGSTVYGEGVNENLYRLTENFACPEKAGTPGTPQDESDLGPGNGINNPINGQPWYNTTTKQLMVYDSVGGQFTSSGGTVVSATPPASPLEGDLWYDTTVPQLKIYDSVAVAFISVSLKYLLLDGTAPMTGDLDLGTVNNIINLAEPANPQDAATKFFVDALRTDVLTGGLLDGLYINATVDDTMDANLTLATTKTIKFGAVPTMTFNVGNGVVANGADVLFANAGLLAANANVHVHIAATGTGNFIVSQGSLTVGAQTDLFTVEKTGRIKANTTSYETLVDANDVLTNKKYVDDEISAAGTGFGIPIGGIIMYSGLFSAIPANFALCDGTSGTPNLTDKFVYGTNTEGQLEATGGFADAVNVQHNHAFTGNLLPPHDHTLVTHGDSGVGWADSAGQLAEATISTSSDTAGTPSGTVELNGISGTDRNIPPYVKLAYIQRLS